MINNKGMTLITIVVILIIMIIIATTSIVAGNRLIVQSRHLKETQIVQNVKEAVLRRKGEIESQGSITPLGQTYNGKIHPSIGAGNIMAENWYLLDNEDLKELGVHDVVGRYLVNYQYGIVLNMEDSYYVEKYLACKYMISVIEKTKEDAMSTSAKKAYYQDCSTQELANKTSNDDTTHKVYVNKETNDVYGSKWYVVTSTDFASSGVLDSTELSSLKTDYLINFEDAQFERIVPGLYAEK